MIVIRGCAGSGELQACVDLQVETWGYDEADVIPRRAFLVAQKIGGQVIGAFDTETHRRRAARNRWLPSHFRCQELNPNQEKRGLTCTPTCWR